MAIAHFVTRPLSRASGASSVHAAAYITRSRMIDERTGLVYDYSRKGEDVIFSGLYVPKAAPRWMHDPGQLWNGAEQIDTRINSRTARTLEVALPHELTDKQNQWLVQDFVREHFTRRGIVAQVAIHKAHEHGDERNVHAHILLSTRFVDGQGFGAKDRDGNKIESLRGWRESWQSLTNRHLHRHGHEVRIDMRTLEAQGIDRTPEFHLGRTAAELERKGQQTDRGDELRAIRAENRVRRLLEQEQQPQPEQVQSAVDRLRSEEMAIDDRAAERDLARGSRIASHTRDILQAVRRLFVTMGGSLGNVIQVEPGDLKGQGRTLRTEVVEQRRQQEIQDAAKYQAHIDSANAKAAAKLAEELATASMSVPFSNPHRAEASQEQKRQGPAARVVPEPQPEATQRPSVKVENPNPVPHQAPQPESETFAERLLRQAAERPNRPKLVMPKGPEQRLEIKLNIRRPGEDDDYRP